MNCPHSTSTTSWLLPPILPASLRLLLALYCFATTFTIVFADGLPCGTQQGHRDWPGDQLLHQPDLLAFYPLVRNPYLRLRMQRLQLAESWLRPL
jgi:hypothetical protein